MVHFLLTPRTLVLEWKVMFLPASYHRQLVIQHQVWVSARQLNRPMGIPSREMRGIKLLGEIILCFSNMVCIWRLPIPRSGAIIQIREMLPLNWQVWTLVVLEIPPPPKKIKIFFLWWVQKREQQDSGDWNEVFCMQEEQVMEHTSLLRMGTMIKFLIKMVFGLWKD